MNGAQALIQTLVDADVDVCFTNPGTSEMHFVAAVDEVPGMRTILGLFEGVVTGAADGYARMTDRPAARCAGWPSRWPAPARGATTSRRGGRSCGRSRRPRP
jgi:hypothetical protein